MKVFIAALIIFCLIFGGVCLNAAYLTHTLAEMQEELAAIPKPDGEQKDLSVQLTQITSLRNIWFEKGDFVSMTINHTDLMEAELQFAAAIGAAEAGSADSYLIAVSQLDYTFGHISDMAGISLYNII